MLQPERRWVRFLTRVCDLLLLNVLSFFSCFTILLSGAAITALYKVTLQMAYQEDCEPVKDFLRALRDNFSTSVPATILLFTDVFFLALLRYALCAETLVFSPTVFVLLLLATVFLTAVLNYLFPLLARFQNTFLRHAENAGRLAVAHLPVTVLLTAVSLCPAMLALFLPRLFSYLSVFWLLIGVAASAYWNSFYLCRIFQQ